MSAAAATQPTSATLRFPWRWIAVGIATYLVFLIASFPAARLTSRLQANGILAAGVSGSIWNGQAAALQVNGITLGPTEWKINAWRLILGTLSVELHSKRDDGYFDATIRTGLSGVVSLHDVRGSLPISTLSRLGLPGGVSGWSGMLQFNLGEIVLVNRWPTEIKGSLNAANLVGPAQQPTPLGGYRITFPAPNVTAPAGEIQGAVTSLDDAPLDVAGTIRLTTSRNYEVNAQVATRANAPASIVKALQYLGPPDAQGKRAFSFAGSL